MCNYLRKANRITIDIIMIKANIDIEFYRYMIVSISSPCSGHRGTSTHSTKDLFCA